MTETDHELWRLAACGDDASFGLLFERHVKAVYNLCFRLTASWSDAEDLTSTVFLTWPGGCHVSATTSGGRYGVSLRNVPPHVSHMRHR